MSIILYYDKQLTLEEFRKHCNAEGRINVNIGVEFNDLMARGGESMDTFNDYVEEQLLPRQCANIGGVSLEDMNYKVVGAYPEKNMVFIAIDADARSVLAELQGDNG